MNKLWQVLEGPDGDPEVDFRHSLSMHNTTVNVVRFSPSGQQLATGGDRGEVMVSAGRPPSLPSPPRPHTDAEGVLASVRGLTPRPPTPLPPLLLLLLRPGVGPEPVRQPGEV